MKDDTKKKLSHNFRYTIYLLIDLFCFLCMSLLIYMVADGRLFIVYISNALFIIWVLIEEKFWNMVFEKSYHKFKKDGFIKRRLKEMLAAVSHKPSAKVVLYVYYLICIAAERLLHFGVAKNGMKIARNLMGIADFKEYLSIMYYSFILLMALDKVKEVMGKENNSRKKHYAKFDE